jgi:hypothetical protein
MVVPQPPGLAGWPVEGNTMQELTTTTVTAKTLNPGDRIVYGYSVVTIATCDDGDIRAYTRGTAGSTFSTCLTRTSDAELVGA